MASPRANFRLKQTLIDEVLEVFSGENASYSYITALEYAVRHKRLELSDNTVPPVRQVGQKLSDNLDNSKLSDNIKEPVRQLPNNSGLQGVSEAESVRQPTSEELDFARELKERLSKMQELPPLPSKGKPVTDEWEIMDSLDEL